MKKKKILVFIDWYLPGYRAGGPIQSCANLIEQLKNEFDFSLVTRNTDYMSDISYPNVRANEWNISPQGIRTYYFSSDNLTKKNIRHLINSESFDVAYLNGIFSQFFTLIPLQILKRKNKPCVVAVRGMLAPGALQQKIIKKKLFLLFARLAGLYKQIIFHCTDETEEKQVINIFGWKAATRIAPNLPGKYPLTGKNTNEKKIGELRMISIARIAPEKNTKFALECLQNVKGKIVFDLYGPVYSLSYWNECKKIIDKLPMNVMVNYKNAVESSSVLSVISNYHFFFMPTLGENFGHAILQALASGIPVIISDKTIWKNLESKIAGWDISLENKKAFAEVIERCTSMTQKEYEQFVNGARELAHAYISNKENLELNKRLFLM